MFSFQTLNIKENFFAPTNYCFSLYREKRVLYFLKGSVFSAGKLHLMGTIKTSVFLSVLTQYETGLYVPMKSVFQTVIRFQVSLRYCCIFIERQCGLREHSSYSPPTRLWCPVLGLQGMNMYSPTICLVRFPLLVQRDIGNMFSTCKVFVVYLEGRMNFSLFWIRNQMGLVTLSGHSYILVYYNCILFSAVQ